MTPGEPKPGSKAFFIVSGKVYFSRSLERRIFFYLTIAMAALGLLVHYGIV